MLEKKGDKGDKGDVGTPNSLSIGTVTSGVGETPIQALTKSNIQGFSSKDTGREKGAPRREKGDQGLKGDDRSRAGTQAKGDKGDQGIQGTGRGERR